MIEIKNITVSYPGRRSHAALSSLSLTIESGAYLAILGANGSGKSTLIKAICGMIPLDSGSIKIDGQSVRPGKFGEDLFAIAAAVFQEPAGQFLMRSVRDEIESVLQNLGLPADEQRRIFFEIISRYSLENLLDRRPENLSGGQMQIVNLACADTIRPRILLLDEPATFLDPRFKEKVLNYIDLFHKQGITILHITQYPDEALRAKKAAIINDGKLVWSGKPSTLNTDPDLLGRYRLAFPDRQLAREKTVGEISLDSASGFDNQYSKSKEVLSIDNLFFEYPENGFKIKIDTLRMTGGKTVGIVGPAGSGKSTIAYLLAGLLKPQRGRIDINGISVSGQDQLTLRKMIGISWQFPDMVFMGPSVLDDLKSIAENLKIDNPEFDKVLELTGLAGFQERTVDTLSGGEKRKLSLAGNLLMEPEILILDEPAAFLDPFSQQALADIINGLSAAGRTILIVSHDLAFLARTVDRIIAIVDGSPVLDVSSRAFFGDRSCADSIGFPAVSGKSLDIDPTD